MIRRISSGSTFEASWGYSRAVVVGHTIHVSGTTGFDYTTMTIASGVVEQTRQAFRNVEQALGEAGASLAAVVRVRYYVTSAADWPEVGKVAGEVFAEVRPAATALVVGLVDPRMRIEIEVEARTGV